MRYAVEIRPSARRELADVPKGQRQRIAAKIDALADDPRPAGCVKLAGGADLWRIRIGNYRVVYTIDGQRLIVQVVRVAHRREVYRGL